MSAIETVKVIVEAEKQAAKMIDDATSEANAIRKKIDSSIQQQRQQMLDEAKKQAADISSRAGDEGKQEADNYETDSANTLKALVSKATSKKSATVEKLVTMLMRVE